jgi:hypothetical protein
MVERYPVFVKALAVVIIVLFGGAMVSQAVASSIGQQARESEEITVSCMYCTLRGLRQVEMSVTHQEAVELSRLMNTTDASAVSSFLSHHGLMPASMNVGQIKALLNGETLKKEFQSLQSRFPQMKSSWMRNMFCSVAGYGRESFFQTPLIAGVGMTIDFALYLFVTLPAVTFGLWLAEKTGNYLFFWASMFFYIPQMMVEQYLYSGQSYIPFKCSPIVVAQLGDTNEVTLPYLAVSGPGGDWNMSTHYSIVFHMFGFCGLWVTFRSGSNFLGAQMKGSCIYINAKGLDKWDGDPWDQWPWVPDQ